MIKGTGKGPSGRDTLFIGLSFSNLDRFRAAPLDSFIRIDGKETGIPFDVMIFSGKTEADMAEMVSQGIGPGTTVYVSDKLKQ